MCGIAGFVGRGDLDVLRRMTARIAHRGPDAEGHWRDEGAGVHLGFRRLSIVDIAGGSQPMHSACKKCGALAITFNGEIYNHAELRAQLLALGHTFATHHSDTEVLLHAYAEWGDDFVQRLNGMWAFVIHDRQKRRIFGSRDRFGKKPLYWFFERGTFAWASELPALAEHPDCPRSLDALSLKKYFAYCYIPAPRSIYERVWKLPGGFCFSYDLPPAAETRTVQPSPGTVQSFHDTGQPSPGTGEPSPGKFLGKSGPGQTLPGTVQPSADTVQPFPHTVEPSPDTGEPLKHTGEPFPGAGESSPGAISEPKHAPVPLVRFSDGMPGAVCSTESPRIWRWWAYIIEPDPALPDLEARLRATLEAATRRRLMSDVPLGVFLSGGIDSSAIAAFAARHTPAGQLNTFSIGFQEKSFDESEYAQLVANTLGTRHHHETLDLETSRALLPGLVARLDEPLGDGSLLPTYLLSKFTRQHVTVALGGDGGDELFAGYDPFKALRAAERYTRWMPRPIHTALKMLAGLLPVSHANVSFDFKVKRFLRGVSHPAPLWNPVWMGALDPAGIGELFREPCDAEEIYSEAIAAWDSCAQPDFVDRSLQWWTNLYLQDDILAKVDRASMLCSLEARSPFLDIEVVDLARRIPHALKLRGGETKWILKRALRGVIPDAIIDRPKKGFGMPIGRWLREGKFEFDLQKTPVGLDRAFIQNQLAAHRSGKRDERLFLWCQWLLNQWLSRV